MTSDQFNEQAIDAMPASPPGYSLLVAADVQDESQTDPYVLGQGARWNPEQIGGGGAVAINCPGDTVSIADSTNPVQATADPFDVFAEDHCTAMSWQSRDFEGRARRQLLATQSFRIAREFQLGAIRDAQSLANYCLKDAEPIHPGDVSVSGAPTFGALQAIATLEAALGETFKGRRCMIHVPPEVFIYLTDGHTLQLQGQRWVTPMGTVVVADAGYTFESDGYFYAYGTSLVQVLLGNIDIWPGSIEQARSMGLIDIKTNKVRLFAQRPAIVRVDGGINVAPNSGTTDAMFKVQLSAPMWATHS